MAKLAHLSANRRRAPAGFVTVYDFGDLGKLIAPKTEKQRRALSRRYAHAAYLGPASGKTIYVPKRAYNALMAEIRREQRRLGIPYICAYEIVVKRTLGGD